MKYCIALALFTLAAACLIAIIQTPYIPGDPQVVSKITTETIYVGSNFGSLLLLGILAFAAGFAGLIVGTVAIDAEKSIARDEINARRR